MPRRSHVAGVIVIVGLASAFPISGLGQERAEAIGGPLTGPTVSGAPFSASAITTITAMRADGTRFERSTPAKYYRDSAGRVRVELMVNGGSGRRITVQPEPGTSLYWLDESTRNARLHAREVESWAVGGGNSFSVQVAANEFLDVHRFSRVQDLFADSEAEALGSRRIQGVDTIGHRVVITVPVGYIGNERAIDIVDERWESPELRILIESRYSDSRVGTVAYRLTNIHRDEPGPNLFVIPDGYQQNAPARTPIVTFSSFERFVSSGR